jgi:hypothetical protein
MTTDFLAASAEAKKNLHSAQARHARARAQADQRRDSALDRHRAEAEAAAGIEASAWRELMAVPGMTVATAGRITQTPPSTVRRWLSTSSAEDTSCN